MMTLLDSSSTTTFVAPADLQESSVILHEGQRANVERVNADGVGGVIAELGFGSDIITVHLKAGTTVEVIR